LRLRDASPRSCTPLAKTDSPTGVGELTVLLPWWRPHLEASNLSPQTIHACTWPPPSRVLSGGCMRRQRWYARRERYSHRMAWAAILVVAACALFATACTAGHPAPAQTGVGTPAPATSPGAHANVSTGPPPVRGAAYTSGGCGATPLLRGPAPGWASTANPPPIRYALAERGQVAGFLFGYPLMAANPQPYSDKILWVVASSRDGLPLRLTGHPLDAATPVVSSTWPADSGPGEIYPSEIVAPSPGCWQFTLSWSGHTDTVDLWYVKHR